MASVYRENLPLVLLMFAGVSVFFMEVWSTPYRSLERSMKQGDLVGIDALRRSYPFPPITPPLFNPSGYLGGSEQFTSLHAAAYVSDSIDVFEAVERLSSDVDPGSVLYIPDGINFEHLGDNKYGFAIVFGLNAWVTPFHISLWHRHYTLANYLLHRESVNPNSKEFFGRSPFLILASQVPSSQESLKRDRSDLFHAFLQDNRVRLNGFHVRNAEAAKVYDLSGWRAIKLLSTELDLFSAFIGVERVDVRLESNGQNVLFGLAGKNRTACVNVLQTHEHFDAMLHSFDHIGQSPLLFADDPEILMTFWDHIPLEPSADLAKLNHLQLAKFLFESGFPFNLCKLLLYEGYDGALLLEDSANDDFFTWLHGRTQEWGPPLIKVEDLFQLEKFLRDVRR